MCSGRFLRALWPCAAGWPLRGAVTREASWAEAREWRLQPLLVPLRSVDFPSPLSSDGHPVSPTLSISLSSWTINSKDLEHDRSLTFLVVVLVFVTTALLHFCPSLFPKSLPGVLFFLPNEHSSEFLLMRSAGKCFLVFTCKGFSQNSRQLFYSRT